MKSFPLQSIEHERDRRFRARVHGDPSERAVFEAFLAAHPPGADRDLTAAAFDAAVTMEYDHGGLSPAIYVLHPLRITNMVTALAEAVPGPVVAVALLHNVIEVGHVTADELTQQFGADIGCTISKLTVDRTRQWEPTYKAAYYATLSEHAEVAGPVKVLDKLDNMFLLCMNPNEAARKRYLDEIERYVVPLAERTLPKLSGYLTELLRDCRATGHRANPYA